jgi:hypothetical protein
VLIFRRHPAYFPYTALQEEMSVIFRTCEVLRRLLLVRRLSGQSVWQYGQISLPTFTVREQYGHGAYPTGARSAADGSPATTANPINGEQIKEKTYQRALLCPRFSANSPTSAASSTHINTKASANTSNPMVHPPGVHASARTKLSSL